jgi:hypothetical protein
MKRFPAVAAAVAILFLVVSIAVAGGKTYQFTGKVLEVSDAAIVVEKEVGGKKEKFEMARDAGTKIKGSLKVGAKVTVQYESRATDIEVKGK